MNLIFMGPQGSGKGTQAKIVSEKLGYIHLSTGEIFRSEIKKGSKIGKLAASLINDGNLVPDNVTNKIVLNKTKELNELGKKIIFDGYPRSENQIKFTLENIPIDKIFLIDVPEDVTFRRISARYHCEKCKKEYNITYHKLKPKQEGICDACGGKLVQRDDDRPEAIKKRLYIYHNETKKILEYFKDKVIEINGDQDIEHVSSDILKHF